MELQANNENDIQYVDSQYKPPPQFYKNHGVAINWVTLIEKPFTRYFLWLAYKHPVESTFAVSVLWPYSCCRTHCVVNDDDWPSSNLPQRVSARSMQAVVYLAYLAHCQILQILPTKAMCNLMCFVYFFRLVQ